MNRFYAPQLGRYMESDPIGLEGGLNPYSYAGNNPVMNVDPTGLDCIGGTCSTDFEQGMYDWWPGYKLGTGIYNSISSGSNQFSFWEGFDAISLVGFSSAKGLQAADSFTYSIGVSSLDMTSPNISRTILKETQVGIGKTPLPQAMTNPQFGMLAGWGAKPEAAWTKVSIGYSIAEIQAMKNAGLTRTMIEQWKGIYTIRNEQRLLNKSAVSTPEARAKLMQMILDKW